MMPAAPAWSDALRRIAPAIHFVWQGDWTPGTVEPPRRLYDHELVIVRRGACEITVDGQVHRCAAPWFLIVPPSAPHSSLAAGVAVVRRLCVHFDWTDQGGEDGRPWWSVLPQPFDQARARPAPRWVPQGVAQGPVPAHRRVDALCEAFLDRWRDGEAGRLRARGALLDLLVTLLVPAWDAPQRDDERSRELATAAKDLLDRTLRAPGPIAARLATLGRSYAHVERSFRRHIGCSPRAYLAAARVAAARALIEQGCSVADAAAQLGFCSSSHLIRIFKAYAGATPGSLRRRVTPRTA